MSFSNQNCRCKVNRESKIINYDEHEASRTEPDRPGLTTYVAGSGTSLRINSLWSMTVRSLLGDMGGEDCGSGKSNESPRRMIARYAVNLPMYSRSASAQ